MAKAGDVWQEAKNADLVSAFGTAAVLGKVEGTPKVNTGGQPVSVKYGKTQLSDHVPGATGGQFIPEAEYGLTDSFLDEFDLQSWPKTVGVDFATLRPDLIEVSDADPTDELLNHEGEVSRRASGDTRIRLRVIDMKLKSMPGPGNFAELAYYSLALAAWLTDNKLDDQYAVAADAAVWAGSHDESALRQAKENGATGTALFDALDEDLEVLPMDVFVSDIRKLLTLTLPQVAKIANTSAWKTDLDWHVQSSCSGCDYLGQAFTDNPKPGFSTSPHQNHCVPQAKDQDHLSRLAYVSRGGTRALQKAQKKTVSDVASSNSGEDCYNEHHNLRANRLILPERAVTLTSTNPTKITSSDAATTAIPKWSDLSLYVTADFDQSSAITLAFGLSGAFFPSQHGPGSGQPMQNVPRSPYYVEHRNTETEREQLALFLTRIHKAMEDARSVDPEATMQVYLWDSLTYEHLVRVVGRHLEWLLAAGEISKLAWMFPPEDLVENERIAKVPVVSIVGSAVRGLIVSDQPHTYTLLGTARRYHDTSFNPAWITTPWFWTTEFSDQIPSERAFDLWTRNPVPVPYAKNMGNLNQTVDAKLNALETVTRRLRADLRGSLNRKSPEIRHLQAPGYQTGTSLLGSLLYAHSKLDAAVDFTEKAHTRSLAVHEREARFAAIRGTKRIEGQELSDLLANIGVPKTPDLFAYEIPETSREAKMKVGDFLVAIAPAQQQGLIDMSPYPILKKYGLANADWYKPWTKTMGDLLRVNIVHLDRQKQVVVVRVDNEDAIEALVDEGIVDLSGNIVIDHISTDFKSSRIRYAAKAIGNPPKAQAAGQELRETLGVTTSGPRAKTTPTPAEDLLWDPTVLEQALTSRDAVATKSQLQAGIKERGENDLNAPQWEAWNHAITRQLSVIWGPPGTGKSRTLKAILEGIAIDATNRDTGENILLTAMTWNAIGNVAEKLATSGVTIFRPNGRGETPPPWATPINFEDPNDRQLLHDALHGPNTVIVAATCQQAQNCIQVWNDPTNHKAPKTSRGGEVFDVIAIDEAGQLDVGLSLLAFAGTKPTTQVIVAGDPLQLAPIHNVTPPEKFADLVGPIYSYFTKHHNVPEKTLLINYRSNEEIVALAREAGYPQNYESFHKDLRLPNQHMSAPPNGWPNTIKWDPSILNLIADPDTPIVCITYPDGIAGQWNDFEADLTTGIVASLNAHLAAHHNGSSHDWIWQEGIGVVTPHRAQRALIASELQQLHPHAPATDVDNAVDTVERFQGSERHAIVASFAVGDPDTIADEAEFIQNLNRFNVLATRAKSKLVVIASDEVIEHIDVDLDTIRASRFLKTFANSYCSQKTQETIVHNGNDVSITIGRPA